MKYTAMDCFSGVGAMALAAVAGFRGTLDIRHMCEIDPFKRGILKKHTRQYWPNVKIHRDIRYVRTEAIRPRPDIIYGGFPCTDISNAGYKQGLGGDESGLWYNLHDLISELRPRIVVLENVSAIDVRGGKTVTAQLAAMGYDGVWATVPAYGFGSPQVRFRWIYVGYANGKRKQKGRRSYRPYSQVKRADLPAQQMAQQRRYNSSHLRGGGCGRIRQSQPAMGRNVARNARRMVQAHRWPAGSWQTQKDYEPARLSPVSETWKKEVEALGDIALPQQLLPFFEAAYEFLRIQDTGATT